MQWCGKNSHYESVAKNEGDEIKATVNYIPFNHF